MKVEVKVNRKNPGLAEPEPVSKSDKLLFYRCAAIGWTIAAALFTAYAFWKDDYHLKGTAGLGWFMVVWTWGFWYYEQRKIERSNRLK